MHIGITTHIIITPIMIMPSVHIVMTPIIIMNCCYEYYISETEYIRNPAKHLCNGLAYVWGIFFFKGISNKDKWELYEELPVLLLCKKISNSNDVFYVSMKL
jgi:hypothetical protein